MKTKSLVDYFKTSLFMAALIALVVSMLLTFLIVICIVYILNAGEISLHLLLESKINIFSVPFFLVFFSLVFWFVVRADITNLLEEKLMQPMVELNAELSNLRLADSTTTADKRFEALEVQQLYDLMASHIKSFHMVYEHLDLLKITEPLTGLFNRRYFHEIAKHESYVADRYNRKFSILVVQLIYLKDLNLNESEQLTRFAQLMLKVVRHADMLFQITDKVFILIAPETDENQVLSLQEEFGTRLAEAKEGFPSFKYEFKLGYATYSDDGKAADDLIRAATKRLQKVEG